MIKSSLSAKARLATVHLPPNPLTDAQWARIEPIIPDWTSRRGGRWRDHHEAISSISRWIHREKYGNWRGVYNRLQMWAVNGTWGRLFTALVAQADADEDLHWVISFDSAVVRAHQHVAGARKTGHQQLSLQDHAIGRSRGGLTPKVHPAPDARCQPQAFVLTAGQAGDAPAFAHIMARLRVPRRRERPRTRPDLVLGRQGVLLPRDPRVPAQGRNPGGHPRSGRPTRPSPAARKPRRQATSLQPRGIQAAQHVERCINRLKQWRGIATRYEMTATITLAGLHIAGVFPWSAR